MANEPLFDWSTFLQQSDFYSFLMPFLLTFVIVYGILDVIKIFKKNSINIIISLAVSFYVIVYGNMGKFFTELYGTGGLIVVGLVVFLIILGTLTLGKKRDESESVLESLFGSVAGPLAGLVIIILFIYFWGTGTLETWGIKIDPDTAIFFIIIILVFILFWYVTRREKERSIWEVLTEDFKKKQH